MMKTLPLLLTLGWFGLYSRTFADLWERWIRWDSEMAHGLPVMLIFVYLLWRDCTQTTWAEKRAGRGVALVALAACSLMWFLVALINIQIVEQVLLIPILASALASLYGWSAIWQRRLLLLFPIFAIPVWGSLNEGLLSLASLVVGESVRLMAIPALIQGNSIYLPYGHILIADGCSGIRYFVIALTLGYLIAYLNGYKEWRMLPMLLVAGFLGLLTNWVRIFVLIVIGHYTEMQSSLMEDHELFGWLLFAAFILPAVYFAPHASSSSAGPALSARSVPGARLAIMTLLAVMGPLLIIVYGGHFNRVDRPAPISDATPTNQPRMPMMVRAPAGALTEINALGNTGVIRTDHYWRDSLEDKLVPYLPRLFDHELWQQVTQTSVNIDSTGVSQAVYVEKGGRRRVVQLQWFEVGGQRTSSRTWAKILQIPATLGGRNEFSIVTLQAECRRESCEEEAEELQRHAQSRIVAVTRPDQALSKSR